MRKGQRFTWPASTVLLAGLVACQPQAERQTGEASAVDTAAVKATLDSLRTVFVAAFEAGEAVPIASQWAEEGIQAGPGVPPVRGRDSIRAALEQSPMLGEVTVIEVTPLDVRVLNEEWAYEMVTMTVRFTPEGAEEPRASSYTYLLVFRNTPDGWKAYREVVARSDGSTGTVE